MDIEGRLENLCEAAEPAAELVAIEIGKLFQSVADDVKRSRFDFADNHQTLIDSINWHGLVADSASFIRERILDSDRAAFFDINLSGKDRSRAALKALIDSELADQRGRDRGFVYFAWRSKPERYLYVGKAASSARVNLDSHGKLLESLDHEKASRLSFIFPAKSTKDNIANLEAALLNLVEFKTGKLPEENSRTEGFSLNYESGAAIHAIRKLIGQIHKKLK